MHPTPAPPSHLHLSCPMCPFCLRPLGHHGHVPQLQEAPVRLGGLAQRRRKPTACQVRGVRAAEQRGVPDGRCERDGDVVGRGAGWEEGQHSVLLSPSHFIQPPFHLCPGVDTLGKVQKILLVPNRPSSWGWMWGSPLGMELGVITASLQASRTRAATGAPGTTQPPSRMTWSISTTSWSRSTSTCTPSSGGNCTTATAPNTST